MAKTEQTLMQLVCSVYQGTLKTWAYLGTVIGLIVAVFFVYALWRFCGAVEINDHLHWAVAAILSGMVIMMLKIWFWLMMVRNAIVRELKGS